MKSRKYVFALLTLSSLALCLLNLYASISSLQNEPSVYHLSHEHQGNNSIKVNVDAEQSALILLTAAQTDRPVFDEYVDPTTESERCKRYGLNYTGKTTRRRVFFGSLIADDSWATIAISAIENYGILHTVAFVESNRTQTFHARNIRFGEGTENMKLIKKLYGPQTTVHVDYYVNEDWNLQSLGREHDQRSLIIERWKLNGMSSDDIGYLADVDEVLTRDFVRALQICEVNEFDHHENCKEPKIDAGTVVFEGSPDCLKGQLWFRPFVVLGECIDSIGDSSVHPRPERSWDGKGWMSDGYTKKTQFASLPKNTTHYPLWNAADIRHNHGKTYGYTWGQYIGYHFHNFFPNLETLRKKYRTYGHAVKDAMEKSLGDIHDDLQAMMHCGLNGSATGLEKFGLVEGGLDYYGSTYIPLAFQIPGYVEIRRRELKEILLKDQVEQRPH
ncbi:hypothetical protein ACHAXN_000552 [Cyclotella atomus]